MWRRVAGRGRVQRGLRCGRRCYSSGDAEAVNYAHRKEIISRTPASYYPSLDSVRDREATTLRVPQFRARFERVDFTQYESKRYPEVCRVEGRISSIRKAGKGMYFIDVAQDFARVQLVASNKLTGVSVGEFNSQHAFLRKGDLVSCVGFPSVTNVGELSVKACEPIRLASPCLNLTTLPEKIVDSKIIKKERVLNYLVNRDLRKKIVVKAMVVQAIRQFLTEREFIEVQTPIIAGDGTGANAEPFVTALKALPSNPDGLSQPLQLRVAPELWLKKLVISGFDKVFEIGPNFRNEGVDLTHNPEFTSCEFYQSFTNLSQLMTMTEELLAYIHSTLRHKNIMPEVIDKLEPLASRSFPKYEFIPTIEKITGLAFPSAITSESLVAYHTSLGVSLPATKSPASLLDNLAATYLEPLSHESQAPIFIFNHPAAMSPLAKSKNITYGENTYDISARFELFYKGKEYVNSYEEENSPYEQASKFQLQQLSKNNFEDNELVIPDWKYVKQMEYGLPPTGGWGCGIDRLAMLFSGSDRIEDVLAFGNLRDVIRQ